MKKNQLAPKGFSTSCSSLVKKTSSPKDSSSSSSVSRNPPAIQEEINFVQEERFAFMGSYSSSNPRIAEDQSMAFLASIDGGAALLNLIRLRDWSMERVLKILYNDPSLLDEIKPNDIVMVAELKLGSLYLQKILKDQDPLYFNKIFNATLDFTYPLMFDPEGTCVLRKLYDLCDSNHLQLIVKKILEWPNLLKSAAKNYTGSGTSMKLIEVLINSTNLWLLKSIVYDLYTEFLSMTTCKHGSILFRFFLNDLYPWQNEILYNRAATHFIDLATNDNGYAFLIALIENTPNTYKKVLLHQIIDNAACLSEDPKGSYVIQATLQLQYKELDCMICEKLVGTYLHLSTHRYGTHVVQECVTSSGLEYPITELISHKKLHILSQHGVGNYVVQKALNATLLTRPDLYYSLVHEIQPYLKDLQNDPFGRHVFELINKRKALLHA